MLTDTKEGEVEGLLRGGQEAARRGNVESARSLLSQVVERDPNNEQAWMWLSGVVEDVAEQQICLENVLVINPDNTKARQGLDYLQSQVSATENAAPAYASDYDAISPGDATPPQFELPQQEQYASAEPESGAPAWETPDPPEGFDISGLELQTSPTLEGSLPWLQNLEQQDNGNGMAQTYNASGFEPAVAALPFDPSAMLNEPNGSNGSNGSYDVPPVVSERHETSFAGVADAAPVRPEAQNDVMPFAPGQDELPMFDFSSFTDASGSGQPANQNGADASADLSNPHFKFEEHVAAQSGSGAAKSGFMELPAGGFSEMVKGPVGPMSEVSLPAPSELPGYKGETSDWAQPWYVENAEQPAPVKVDEPAAVPFYSSSLTPEQQPRNPSTAKSSTVTTMKCPNCQEDVADTSLACPNCRFTFFLNCPNCHELVDASEAVPGKVEKCPHCSATIDLIKLGQSGVDGAAQYQSTKLAAVGASSLLATSLDANAGPRRRMGFGWVVDLVWLVTIIAIVWALTQLPTWLHLTGQY